MRCPSGHARPRPALGAGLLVLGFAAPAGAQEALAGRWTDVELPEGFHLDLRTGEVSSRTPDAAEGVASYIDGRLHARPPLRAWERGGAERMASSLPRGGGRVLESARPERGDELLFEVDARTWGYLRVLDAGSGALGLEYARARAGDERLRRDPADLEVSHPARGVGLAWRGGQGAEYEVRRSIVGRPDERDVLLQRVRGDRFEDVDAPSGVLLEYHVARTDGEHAERPFGARARVAVELVPPTWPIAIERGSRVDLLSGELDGPGAHLEVLRAVAPHLQVRPLGGTRLAVLGPREQVSWTLPALEVADYADALRTLRPDDELAVDEVRYGPRPRW